MKNPPKFHIPRRTLDIIAEQINCSRPEGEGNIWIKHAQHIGDEEVISQIVAYTDILIRATAKKAIEGDSVKVRYWENLIELGNAMRLSTLAKYDPHHVDGAEFTTYFLNNLRSKFFHWSPLLARVSRVDREAIQIYGAVLANNDTGASDEEILRKIHRYLRDFKGHVKQKEAFSPNWWTLTKILEVRAAIQYANPIELDAEILETKSMKDNLRDPKLVPDDVGVRAADFVDDHISIIVNSKAWQALDDRERTVLEMHYFDDLPFTQIAIILGYATNIIQKIEERAKEKLARTLSLELGIAYQGNGSLEMTIEEEILKRRDEGKTNTDIANVLLHTADFILDIVNSQSWHKLTKRQKEIIELHYLNDDLSLSQIAVKFEVTRQSIQQTEATGLKNLFDGLLKESESKRAELDASSEKSWAVVISAENNNAEHRK